MAIAAHWFHFLALGLWQSEINPEQFQSGSSVIWMFVQTIVALGFVCLLAYLLLRVVLPRLNLSTAGKSMVSVVDRTPLDQRRSLFVIEVTGRWLLIAVSEGGVQLISELDADKAAEASAALRAAAASTRARVTLNQAGVTARTTFSDVLARFGNRRQ
ncbi:MAG TPA: flagellar biosynthetic protein FliO [Pyrinomonadaceae bacterium]|nr:flagellar biosynthetic protein FliO [Pyrinomonadaceae bacterium]